MSERLVFGLLCCLDFSGISGADKTKYFFVASIVELAGAELAASGLLSVVLLDSSNDWQGLAGGSGGIFLGIGTE